MHTLGLASLTWRHVQWIRLVRLTHLINVQPVVIVALFPGSAQLSVACSSDRTASDGKLGGAWERGYGDCLCFY